MIPPSCKKYQKPNAYVILKVENIMLLNAIVSACDTFVSNNQTPKMIFFKNIKITYCTHMIFMVYVQYKEKCPQSPIFYFCIDLFFSKLRRIKFTSFLMLDWFLWFTII